ncbi:MAG TPA: hypothetical protein VGH63_09350 [Polyangia bacterium]
MMIQQLLSGADGDALPWEELIEEVVLAGIREQCDAARALCRTAFVTGSYVHGTFSRLRPNLNVYFIAWPDRSAELRLALARAVVQLRARLRERGVELAIDCHPYTVAQRDPKWLEQPTLTLTTKILDGAHAHNRYSLPPTIGLGWLAAHRVLWGEADALRALGFDRDDELGWLTALHEALGRYRNLLDHLPFALAWHDDPFLLAEESVRYAEEALKDGVAAALSVSQLNEGAQWPVLSAWRARGEEFYAAHYGPDGVVAVQRVAAMKERLAEPIIDIAEAEALWRHALEVWRVVWRRFCTRVPPTHGSWLTRVNAFV